MPLAMLLTLLGLLLTTSPVAAMPLNYYSCDLAEEKLAKAQTALKVAQEDLQAAQRQEQVVRAELEACLPGGLVSLNRVRRCAHARKTFPDTITDTLESTHRVQDHQQEVRERQTWQVKVCGATAP